MTHFLCLKTLRGCAVSPDGGLLELRSAVCAATLQLYFPAVRDTEAQPKPLNDWLRGRADGCCSSSASRPHSHISQWETLSDGYLESQGTGQDAQTSPPLPICSHTWPLWCLLCEETAVRVVKYISERLIVSSLIASQAFNLMELYRSALCQRLALSQPPPPPPHLFLPPSVFTL